MLILLRGPERVSGGQQGLCGDTCHIASPCWPYLFGLWPVLTGKSLLRIAIDLLPYVLDLLLEPADSFHDAELILHNLVILAVHPSF